MGPNYFLIPTCFKFSQIGKPILIGLLLLLSACSKPEFEIVSINQQGAFEPSQADVNQPRDLSFSYKICVIEKSSRQKIINEPFYLVAPKSKQVRSNSEGCAVFQLETSYHPLAKSDSYVEYSNTIKSESRGSRSFRLGFNPWNKKIVNLDEHPELPTITANKSVPFLNGNDRLKGLKGPQRAKLEKLPLPRVPDEAMSKDPDPTKKDPEVRKAGPKPLDDPSLTPVVEVTPEIPALSLTISDFNYRLKSRTPLFDLNLWANLTETRFIHLRFKPQLTRRLKDALEPEPQRLATGDKLKIRLALISSDSRNEVYEGSAEAFKHFRYISDYQADVQVDQDGYVTLIFPYVFEFREGPLLETYNQLHLSMEVIEESKNPVKKFIGVTHFKPLTEGSVKRIQRSRMSPDAIAERIIDPKSTREPKKFFRSFTNVIDIERVERESSLLHLPQNRVLRKPRHKYFEDYAKKRKSPSRDYFLEYAKNIPENITIVELQDPELSFWPRAHVDPEVAKAIAFYISQPEFLYPLANISDAIDEKDITPRIDPDLNIVPRKPRRFPPKVRAQFAGVAREMCAAYYTDEKLSQCQGKNPLEYVTVEFFEFLTQSPNYLSHRRSKGNVQAMASYFREDLISQKLGWKMSGTESASHGSLQKGGLEFLGNGGTVMNSRSWVNSAAFEKTRERVEDERLRGRVRGFENLKTQQTHILFSAEVETCVLFRPVKLDFEKDKDAKKIHSHLTCVKQIKTGIEHSWYYLTNLIKYDGFYSPSNQTLSDRPWLKQLRGRDLYWRLDKALKSNLIMVLKETNGSRQGVSQMVEESLRKAQFSEFEDHPVGQHADLGIFPGVIYYKKIE